MAAEKLPAPLVPAYVNLQDFQYMPLDVKRFRDCDFVQKVDNNSVTCGLLLWCASWHQLPASSLPDDDKVLAAFAGYGKMVHHWKKVREDALYGFVKCSDGRFYHPVIAEKALEAWASKQQHAYGKSLDRLRKENKKRKDDGLPELAAPSFERWSVDTAAPQPDAGNPPEGHRKSAGKRDVSAGNPQEPSHVSEHYSAGNDETSAGFPSEGIRVSGGKSRRSAGIPPENALKGKGKGKGYIKEGSNIVVGRVEVSSSDPPKTDDDDSNGEVEKALQAWFDWFVAEQEWQPKSDRDRARFENFARGWVDGKITPARMAEACAWAKATSKNAIGDLPGYVDMVLRNMPTGAKANGGATPAEIDALVAKIEAEEQA